RLAWPLIERVQATRHARYGLRWSLLEIETPDGLHLFGAAELGAPPAEVARELARLRPGW
ncbi:MAG TPA: PH domain-containing protein, partial [Thermopolyspora sp.]